MKKRLFICITSRQVDVHKNPPSFCHVYFFNWINKSSVHIVYLYRNIIQLIASNNIRIDYWLLIAVQYITIIRISAVYNFLERKSLSTSFSINAAYKKKKNNSFNYALTKTFTENRRTYFKLKTSKFKQNPIEFNQFNFTFYVKHD